MYKLNKIINKYITLFLSLENILSSLGTCNIFKTDWKSLTLDRKIFITNITPIPLLYSLILR
jgi:hypothetical protein